MIPPLPPDLFVRFRDVLHRRSLIWFPENRAYLLESKLKLRLAGLGLSDYAAYLAVLEGRGGQEEFEALIAEIATNETSFFRTPPQIELLRDRLIPRLAEEHPGEPLRIWSAGCSSGEEPYTIAILLSMPPLDGIRARIFANDISTRMVDRARTGIYDRYALRQAPPDVIRRFFTPRADGKLEIAPSIRQMVEFSVLNFADDRHMMNVPPMDLIVCRNTLIYFSDEGKRRCVEYFRNTLRDRGYLLLGHAETLWGFSSGFQYQAFPKAFAYRKEARASRVGPPAAQGVSPLAAQGEAPRVSGLPSEGTARRGMP